MSKKKTTLRREDRPLPQLYSVAEAAECLGGVSKRTIHAWLSQGRFQRIKVGSRTMIRASDLRAFLGACNATIHPIAHTKTRPAPSATLKS